MTRKETSYTVYAATAKDDFFTNQSTYDGPIERIAFNYLIRFNKLVWLFAELRETIPEGIFKIAKPYVFMTAKEVHVNHPMNFVVT